MKKLNLLLTALLLMCCVGTAKAVEVTIDGIKYDVITKAKQATVIKDSNYSGNIVIPSEITYNNVTCSVTSIGDHAFEWCSGLTSITIPNSVTSIGTAAFYYCEGLKEVHINDIAAWCNINFDGYNANPLYYAHNLYLNNELITELVIPNGVTSIGDAAFSGCSGLTSITIPNSVTSIGEMAFYYCSGLKEVHINDLAAWCSINFGYNYANPLSYAQNLYLNNELITELVIPNGVTSIGERAFKYCSGLTSVTIPNSVTSIGSDAFDGCDGLKEVHINDIVAWYNIDFENGSANPLSYAQNLYLNNELITELVIPNGVTSIKNYAFFNCKGLTSITIPNSLTSIGGSAFYGCTALTSITIPNSVTSIGNYAFSECDGLTSITIPKSVKSIGQDAFSNCENLADVYCLATDVPRTKSDAFSGSYPEYMKLHVPAEAIDSYKTTEPWSSFGNIVTLDGDIVETPKCDNPVIKYNNGEIEIECETADAEFVTEVTSNDLKKFYSDKITFSATYNISVYATAAGYDNSDTVNATLCWIECDCSANDNTTDVINVPAKALFVTSNNGTININCALEGEVVELYTSDAMYIGSTTIENGSATIESGLSKGDIAIIKIAEKSIKVILN